MAIDNSTRWEDFFQSLLDILEEHEYYSTTADNGLRDHVLGRLEYAEIALQQLLPLVVNDHECYTCLLQLSTNFRLLALEWRRGLQLNRSTQCTNVAIYSLSSPPLTRTDTPGRPRFQISKDVLVELRTLGFTWKSISDMLLVSRWTIQRRVNEYDIQEVTGYSSISDSDLDMHVRQCIDMQSSVLTGRALISGYLQSLGLKVQRDRIRASISRVDPVNARLRWAVVTYRRVYSVPGPNSLWHLDGHHSLINWGFVIHGGIDGFSRLIVYLHCSTNNRSDTVGDLFNYAVTQFNWPSRVRTDHGGENVTVWETMEEARGSNRGSYLTGSSTHNQRIERLWRDVFCNVCHTFYYTFQAMEESGMYWRDSPVHKFVLHYVFLPRINQALECFTRAWNHHPMRTENNWSPLQMWTNGMLDIRNQGTIGVSDVALSDTEIEDLTWFGFDPHAPMPDDDGLSTVEVNDVEIELAEDILEQLRSDIDPLSYSNSFGIDIYENALLIVSQ